MVAIPIAIMALAKWMKKYKKDSERLNNSASPQQHEKKYLRRHSFHPDIMAAPPKNGTTTPGPPEKNIDTGETQNVPPKVNITKTRHVNSEKNHDTARRPLDSDKKNDRLFPKTTKTTNNIAPTQAAGNDNLECETPSRSRNVKLKKATGHHRKKPNPNARSNIPSNNAIISEPEPDNDPTDEDEAKDEVEEMKNSSGAVIISCQRRLSDGGLMSPFKKDKNNHHYPPSSPTKSAYIQIKHHLHCGHDEQFQAQQKMLQQHQYHQGGH